MARKFNLIDKITGSNQMLWRFAKLDMEHPFPQMNFYNEGTDNERLAKQFEIHVQTPRRISKGNILHPNTNNTPNLIQRAGSA
jgi:hypothetical protein